MKFILGLVVGAVLVPVLLLAYLASGFAPTAATDKPFPGESLIAAIALQRRIQKEAPARDLSVMTSADLLAGADNYKKDCAVCHGLPDQPAAPIGQGMFPGAPQLLMPPPPGFGRGRGGPGGPGVPGVPNRAPRRNGDFWRIKNGIRLTGMPSFEKSLTDDQIWQLVALLQSRRDMPPAVKAELLSDVAPPVPIPVPAPPLVRK
jgi:thiosulfate dehydrogenase